MSVYIVAEIGPNHNGSVEVALRMVDKLSEIGVNAVKFQLCTPESVYSLDSFKPAYQNKGDKSTSPLEMSKKYQLSREDHIKIYGVCREKKIDYVCSAFDLESLIFLDSNFEMPFFKIPSGEIFSVDMLEYVSSRDKPVVISTGMTTYTEVGSAIEMINIKSQKNITILHCVSNYPASYEEVNLKIIPELKIRFNCAVGFSDHTIGNQCAIAAVSLGASLIEKHVTCDQNQNGPDHKASATIDEFEDLVKGIRNTELAMGGTEKVWTSAMLEIKNAACKSIVSKRDLLPGDIITEKDICFKRPGIGFLPTEKECVLGKRVRNKIGKNRVIKKCDIV